MNEYSVTFNFTNKAGYTEQLTTRFPNERAAARQIISVEIAENQELVSYSENIDRAKYRY